MQHSTLLPTAWFNAIPLHERIAVLPKTNPNSVGSSDPKAQRRLQRWQAQTPFQHGEHFQQRLHMDQLSEEVLLHLLSEPVEAMQQRFPRPLGWMEKVQKAFAQPGKPVLTFKNLNAEQQAMRFLHIIEPLISQACDRLRGGVWVLAKSYSTNQRPFDPATIERVLFANLPDQLLEMINRTLILELNVARVEGRLHGETAQARFNHFVQSLQQRDIALALLQEYPVLTRQVVNALEQWVNFSLEFLRHLCADWKAIRNTFSPQQEPGLLSEVKIGGDRHSNGRAVGVVTFSKGFQLVYKPKSMAVDIHFQQLLTWLNQHGDHPPFRTIKVLDRQNHGWVEFVQAAPCQSAEEIQRFYQRQGGYLALLYVLQATDFHYENLIAAGEQPVLIDLESLFHPEPGTNNGSESDAFANMQLSYSVLRVGLLPQRSWVSEESDGIDISGLSAVEGQLSPRPVAYMDGAASDEMRISRKRIEMSGGNNQPSLMGAKINVLDYQEALLTGFRTVYQLLQARRHELLALDGPITRFANDEVRVILRPTRLYGMILQESYHPDVLRQALERDRLFDRLWIQAAHQPYLTQVIAAERDDLWRGDIPIFATRPDTCDLFTSTKQVIPDFFKESGMALVQHRLQELDERDLERQCWFIRGSLTTLAIDQAGHSAWSSYQLQKPSHPVTHESLLAAACKIGDKLELVALQGAEKEDASWIGLSLVKEKHWVLTPIGTGLYDGIAGVVFFLAWLGKLGQEERYTRLARAGLLTVQRRLEAAQPYLNAIGAFTELGGSIYLLTQLGLLWDAPTLLDEAEKLIDLIPPLIEKDTQFDIIGGSAGCIAVLLGYYRVTGRTKALEIALQCGEWLQQNARPMEQGIGWVVKNMGEKPLSGLSHGSSGIAWALLELAAISQDNRFRQTALDALTYERTLFSPQEGNWHDLRGADETKEDTHDKFMCAWCHGAAGIGLGRLALLKHVNDEMIRTEINAALKTTLSRGFGMNHSLCHGDLGNLELFLQAGQLLNHAQLQEQTQMLSSMILESIEQQGPLCGVPLGVETPGLMTGLAGIGYQLLRLADPNRVPSVLLLQTPTAF